MKFPVSSFQFPVSVSNTLSSWRLAYKISMMMGVLFCEQVNCQIYTPTQTPIAPNVNMGIGQINPDSRLHIQGITCRPYSDGEQSYSGIPSASHIKLESIEQDCGSGQISIPPPIFSPLPLLSQWWDINGGIGNGLRFRTSYDNSTFIDLLNLNENTSTLFTNQFKVSNFLQVDQNSFYLNGVLNASAGLFSVGGILWANSSTFNFNNRFIIDADGMLYRNASNVGVFHISNTGLLRVREIYIDNVTVIPDYVFNATYPLMPLDQLENYITTHKHLPGIKSEKEVQATGAVNIGEMNMKLLEKVEELTLYVIELKKEIAAVKNGGKK